jgi:hypothetical protein
MNLAGFRQLELRSSKRRGGVRLSFYKYFTPNGVGQPLFLVPTGPTGSQRLPTCSLFTSCSKNRNLLVCFAEDKYLNGVCI